MGHVPVTWARNLVGTRWPRLYQRFPTLNPPETIDDAQLTAGVWAGVTAGFYLFDNHGDPVGLATVYGARWRHRTASFEVVVDDGTDERLVTEAAALVADYAFALFPLRVLHHVGIGVTGPGTVEARFADAMVVPGGYADRVVTAVRRDRVSARAVLARPRKAGYAGVQADVSLRPLVPDDVDVVRDLELGDSNLVRWAWAGEIPSPVAATMALAGGNAKHRAVVLRDEPGRPIGLVGARGASERDGTANLVVMMAEPYHQSGAGVMAMVQWIDELADTYPLRKLYAEVNEANLADFGSVLKRGYVREEGRLREFYEFGTETFDAVFLTVDLADWRARIGPRVKRFVNRRAGSPA
jgi:RimJ/RimL family protein N-acetyltransferase